MKNIPLIISLLALCSAWLYPVQAQQPFVAISGNSNVVCLLEQTGTSTDTISSIDKGGKQKWRVVDNLVFTAKVYLIDKGLYVQQVEFKTPKKAMVEEIKLNHTGKLLHIQTDDYQWIYDVLSGKILLEATRDEVAGMASFEQTAFITRDNTIRALSVADSLTAWNIYRISNKENVEELYTVFDDNYLVAKAQEDKYIIWETDNPKRAKRYKATELLFQESPPRVIMAKEIGGRLNLFRYAMPDYTKEEAIIGMKAEKSARETWQQLTDEKMVPERCSVSPDGNYTAFYMQGRNHCLILYDNLRMEVWSVIFGGTEMKSLYPYTWVGETYLAFQPSPEKALLYSIQSDRFVMSPDYHFPVDQKKLSALISTRNVRQSPDFRYAIHQSYEGGIPFMQARSGAIPNFIAKAPEVEFLHWTPDSRYMLVRSKDSKTGFIATTAIESLPSDTLPLPVTWFPDTMKTVPPEAMVPEDAPEPEGYNYSAIKEFRHISTLPPDKMIRLHLKTIDTQDSTAGLQVHLIDDEGVYYYGASEPQWRFIWKRLLLQAGHGARVNEIKDFTISEHRTADNEKSAIALALDMSGSMGEERALACQKGAKEFIRAKKAEDAICIIKYDEDIEVEVPLSPTTDRLLKYLRVNGLGKFGGSTALLDGIEKGVDILKRSQDAGSRAVILFTDGNENSSYTSKGDLLRKAAGNDAAIYTLGFGDYVSESYLAALSSYTNGSYYRIYSTNDFAWVFTDIYQRMQNYYTLTFRTDTLGVFTAMLEISLDDLRKDSLSLYFDNRPVDYDLINSTSDENFRPLVGTATLTPEQVNEFQAAKSPDSAVVMQPIVSTVETDFEGIHFPDIKFVTNTVDIVPGSEAGIEELAAFLKKYPEVNIEIHGHTDNTGSSQRNYELSVARAEKVKALLVKHGVKAKRLIVKGFGADVPLSDNNTAQGRSANRRVVFKLAEKE